jgi:hypothetical protein
MYLYGWDDRCIRLLSGNIFTTLRASVLLILNFWGVEVELVVVFLPVQLGRLSGQKVIDKIAFWSLQTYILYSMC